MTKLVMLGDSVFDNSDYLQEGEHDTDAWVRHYLQGEALDIDFLALDGATTACVRGHQLGYIDPDAEYIVLSIGGNDLLNSFPYLVTNQGSMKQTFSFFEEMRTTFNNSYGSMINAIRSRAPKAKFMVFDIYYPFWELPEPFSITNLEVHEKASRVAIDLFNKTIRDRFRDGEVRNLAAICCEKRHFANQIEPSTVGSQSIAQKIRDFYEQSKLPKIPAVPA